MAGIKSVDGTPPQIKSATSNRIPGRGRFGRVLKNSGVNPLTEGKAISDLDGWGEIKHAGLKTQGLKLKAIGFVPERTSAFGKQAYTLLQNPNRASITTEDRYGSPTQLRMVRKLLDIAASLDKPDALQAFLADPENNAMLRAQVGELQRLTGQGKSMDWISAFATARETALVRGLMSLLSTN